MIGGTGIVPAGNAPTQLPPPVEKDTFVPVKKSNGGRRLLIVLGVILIVVLILLVLVWRFGSSDSSTTEVGAPEAGAIRAGLRLVAEDVTTLRKNFAMRLAAYLNVSVDCISLVTASAANTGDYLDVVFDILPSDPALNRTCTTPNVTLTEIYDYLAANPGGIQLAGGATELKVRCSDGSFQAPPCIDPDDTAFIPVPSQPFVEIISYNDNPTANSPMKFQARFNRTVYWFVSGDIVLLSGNGKVATFTQIDGRTYNFVVYATTSGEYSLQVLGASCQDRLKQYNMPSAVVTIQYNGGPPTLDLVTASSIRLPTNVASVPMVATWSSNVTGFTASDITVSGGYTVSNFVQGSSANIYTFNVGTLSGVGSVSLYVAANAVASTAGTNNDLTDTVVVTFDLVAPDVVLASNITSVTKEPFMVSASFSEAVIGFSLSSVASSPSSGIVKADLVSPTSTYSKFQVIVSGSYSGNITLQALRGAATDLAYNLNTASNILVIPFDNVPPTVTLVSDAGTLTGANPIPVSIHFSEVLATAPTLAQLVVTGCTAANFTKISALVWSVELTPTQTAITVDYAASQVTDIAANSNTAATQLSITWSSTRPSVVITTTTATPSPDTPIAVTFTFSEPVVDFSSSSPTILNGVVIASSIVDVLGDGSQYSFNVRPSINGTITIALPANTVHDDAGNGNLVATSLVMVHDAIPPYFTASSSTSDPTNSDPIPFTVVASETLDSPLAAGLFTITGGSLVSGSFQATGLTATFSVTPSTTSSVVIISITATTIDDLAGNPNVGFAFQRTYDAIRPTAVFSSDFPYTQSRTLSARVTFSEAIQSFVASNIAVTGAEVVSGSLTLVTSSPLVYSFNLVIDASATTSQAITLQLAANTVADIAGNGNVASAVFNMAFDTIRPTCTISSTAGDPYPLSPVPMIATFSEAVNGFALQQLNVTGGTASNLVGGPLVYTFDVTPSISSGRILLVAYVPAAATTDLAGNSLIASNNFTQWFDTTVTIVTITSTLSNPGNVVPVPFVATFSKAVTGFSSSSIMVAGGTLSNFAAQSGGRIYTWDMTTADSYANMTAYIVDGAATDLLGVTNVASPVYSYIYDTVAPTFTLAFPNGVRSSPVSVILTWSKPVTGFTASDVVLSPGGLNLFAGSGATYTFQVTLSADSSVSISTATGAVVDAAGNPSGPLLQSFIFDSTPPVVTLTPSFSSPSNVIPVPYTATFSEPVYNFTNSSITVTNGVLLDFAVVSTTQYTFTVNGTALRSHMIISVIAGGAYDASFNPVALTSVQFISDRQPPVFVIRSGIPSPSNQRSIPVSAVFDEVVVGLSSSAFVVDGGVISAWTQFNASLYTFTLTANTAWVMVTVSVAAGSCTDEASNPCPAFVFTHLNDQVAPNVTFTPAHASPSFVSPLMFTATFSEAIASFTASSLTVVNATVANVVQVSSSVYTFEVTPIGTYVVIVVSILDNAVTDIAGNGIVLTRITHLHDGIAPVLTIYPLQTSPSSATSFSYIALWSKTVGAFNESDITVGGGTLTSFVGADGCQAYTVGVTPGSDTAITLDVSAGAAYDAAGNTNAATNQVVITRDSTPPSVTITPTVSLTNVSPVQFTATFSEAVYGLTLSDIQAWGGTVDSFTVVSDTVCKFSIIPNTTQGVVQGGILAGHVVDGAGNVNTFGQGSATYDVQQPSVVLSSTSDARSSVSPIPFTATFSETVTGLTEANIQTQVVGGTIVSGSLTAVSSSVYTFTVTPSSTWVMVAVQIAAATASDTIGNTNTASNVVTIEHDTSLPTCTLTSPDGTPQSAATVSITVTFSAGVYGFNSSSIVISGGTLVSNSFTVTSTSVYTISITPSSDPQLVSVSIPAGKALSVSGDRPAQSCAVNIVHATVPAPTANADTYTLAVASAGVSAASGVLANDQLPSSSGYSGATLVVVAGTSTSTNGATVTMAADGSFTYSGGSATDSFTYTLSYTLASPDTSAAALQGTTATGTVTIT